MQINRNDMKEYSFDVDKFYKIGNKSMYKIEDILYLKNIYIYHLTLIQFLYFFIQ